MIFVGSKVFTHARYWQIKIYVCMIFLVGAPGGGGGTCPPAPPPPPRSYAPAVGPMLLPSQVVFSCWGTQNSQMVSNQENMESDQPVQTTVTYIYCKHRPVCRRFVLVKQDSLCQFSRPFWLDCPSQLPQQFPRVVQWIQCRLHPRRRRLPQRLHHLGLLSEGGEKISGSKWWTQPSSWVTKRLRELAGSV